MGETTGIAWTDSTINVWHGCEKVDALCKHCYAEVSTPVRVKRAKGLEVWGPKAARTETKSWERDLRRWNREAAASGKVHRVFGQSLSDTFEDYSGGRVVYADGSMSAAGLMDLRARFFAAIEAAPSLTFQLLTKRPEHIVNMVPTSWRVRWPAHVWIGTSVGDQESAEERIPHLLRVPAPVRFLSVEPQIGPVDLSRWLAECGSDCGPLSALAGRHRRGIRWVIQGGESGPRARPFDLAWARSLRDQCRAASVPYFLKQLGAAPVEHPRRGAPINGSPATIYDAVRLRDSHGGDESEWPADLRGCRAFPGVRP